MNLIEILKAKGVSDETIAAIQEDMKANSIYTASEENLDIRYKKLKEQHETQGKQFAEANTLIETLQQSNKGNEALQQQVTDYKTENAKLTAQLLETKIDAEVQIKLLAEGVKPDDIDYVMFKLKAKGELEMGEDGKVKGLEDKVAAMKTQLPAHFTSENKKNIIENKLPTNTNSGGEAEPKNLAEALQLQYESKE